MKTRVCLLIDTVYSPSGGTEKQLLQLLRHMDRDEFEPRLCVLRNSDWLRQRFDLAPLDVLGLDSFRRPSGWAGVLRLASLLRRHRIDVVHTHFRDASIAGIPAAKLAGVRGVVAARRNQGYWMTPLELRLQRTLNRWVDVFVANSDSTRRWCRETEGVPTERVLVVYNGLDLAAFDPADAGGREAVRRDLGIPPDAPAACIVANMRPVKRMDVFLRAAARARQSVPGARFVVVGDGPQRGAMEALARELELDGSVIFLGNRNDVPRLLPAMDVGVLASDSESFSNSVAEYMASGLAVAATDVGGCREALGEEGVGAIVASGDHAALGEALAGQLLDRPALLRARRDNPARAAELFSLSECVRAHESVYRRLAGNDVASEAADSAAPAGRGA
ncbi:glycosyltransferase [Desulfohalovibrio reitneri]|uniref:glycosyltransferase n=1 Tax=Desulfohalovibrio reitneri TaxID=1307759 RepID=UPI0004A78046|nr:glycosyltransferase [Desulfohalovibrio reitneri]